MAISCGECLWNNVEIVALNERGICPTCGTNYGPDQSNRPVHPPSLWYDYTAQAWVEDGRYKPCGHIQPFASPCFACKHAGEIAPLDHYIGPAATV
jgi:hypothetical protein